MSTPDVNAPMILDALERHRVAIPPTRYIDITPAATAENVERLAAALGDLQDSIPPWKTRADRFR